MSLLATSTRRQFGAGKTLKPPFNRCDGRDALATASKFSLPSIPFAFVSSTRQIGVILLAIGKVLLA
jgi:hypothetical protein